MVEDYPHLPTVMFDLDLWEVVEENSPTAEDAGGLVHVENVELSDKSSEIPSKIQENNPNNPKTFVIPVDSPEESSDTGEMVEGSEPSHHKSCEIPFNILEDEPSHLKSCEIPFSLEGNELNQSELLKSSYDSSGESYKFVEISSDIQEYDPSQPELMETSFNSSEELYKSSEISLTFMKVNQVGPS